MSFKTKTIEKLVGEGVDVDHQIEAAEEVRNQMENDLDHQYIKIALLRNKRREIRLELREYEEGGNDRESTVTVDRIE